MPTGFGRAGKLGSEFQLGLPIPTEYYRQRIRWAGFESTFGELLRTGWRVTRRTRWHKPGPHRPLEWKGEYIYIENPGTALFARATIERNQVMPEVLQLDFLINRKQYGRKRILINERVNAYGPEDIEVLLTIIRELQEAHYPKKPRKRRPSAEVIRMARAA